MPFKDQFPPETLQQWVGFWKELQKSGQFKKLSPEQRADLLALGADVYFSASRSSGHQVAHLKKCIQLWTDATNEVPIARPYWTPYRLHNYLLALWELIDQEYSSGRHGTLLSVGKLLLDDLRTDPMEKQTYRMILGLASLKKFEETLELGELLAAIDVAISCIAERDFTDNAVKFLGRALAVFNQHRKQLIAYEKFREWLDSAFSALVVLNQGVTTRAPFELAGALFEFYVALPVTESTARAVRVASAAFNAAPAGWPNLGLALFDLSRVFFFLHLHAANRAHLDEAIQAAQRSVNCPVFEFTGKANYELGRMLNERAMRFGTLDDLKTAVEALESALHHGCGDDNQAVHELLMVTRIMCGIVGKDPQVVHEPDLLRYFREMATTTDVNRRKAAAQTLSFFAGALGVRYETSGNVRDLERSHALLMLAYAFSDHDPIVTSQFVTALLARHARTGTSSDLDHALSILDGIDLTRVPDKDIALSLHVSKADALARERHRNGDFTLLTEIVRLRRFVARSMQSGQPGFAYALSKLADALFESSIFNDAGEDLKEAMALYDQAARCASDQETAHMVASNRAAVLQSKARMSGTADDWEKAIDQLRICAESRGGVPPTDRPALLDNFLRALLRRYRSFCGEQDLRECIDVGERSLAEAFQSRATGELEHRLGHQRLWYRVYEDLVDAYLMLAELRPDEATDYIWRAFDVVESVKGSVIHSSSEKRGADPETLARIFDKNDHAETRAEELLRNALGQFEPEVEHRSERLPVPSRSVRDYCQQLHPDTAIISAFETETTTWWFVVTTTCDRPHVLKTAITRSKWTDILQRMVRELFVEEFSGSQTWLSCLNELRALDPMIRSVTRVILSNHQATVRLPWSIVTRSLGLCGRRGDPVPILMVPGLESAFSQQAPHVPTPGSPLVVGNPTGDLEHASAEAKVVGEMLGVQSLTAQTATMANVLHQFERASVIHVASHARIVDSDGFVCIRLADGDLSIRDIVRRRVSAKLVVLSACWSGLSTRMGREEFVGLPQAFLGAGAANVVATLWKVEDSCTTLLMKAFYTEWLNGQGVAEALNLAISELSCQPKWQHPHWWGAFFATGRHVFQNGG